MKHFKFYEKKDILHYTKVRKFETKLGERVNVIEDHTNLELSLQKSHAKFVVFGVCEDIGVKANYGVGGTSTAWHPFMTAFLNTQSNDFLDGNEILFLGNFDFSEVERLIEANAHDEEERLEAYRHAVNMIDVEVEQLIHIITQNKKLPIVIGGGQNNAYPCIKGAAKGWNKAGVIEIPQINAINLDAHADFRPLEGRHSGNAFHYADEDGYLEKYFVVGLHENYLPQSTWIEFVNNPFTDCVTYEDIFVHEKQDFMQAIATAVTFTEDTLTGIEIDLDCIQNTLSSALSPVGVSPNHARQYISLCAADSMPAYLHICEGATEMQNGQKDITTGKLISYLVSDFIKGVLAGIAD